MRKYRLQMWVRFIVVAVAMAVPSWCQNYITGGDTGPENKLDNSPTNQVFNLTVNGAGSYSLAGGNFFMKAGTIVIAPVTLTIFDSGNSVLGSVTQTAAQFCSSVVGNCQSFAYHTFTFASPVSLPGGGATYTAVLSTDADPQQNRAYFIKLGGITAFVLDTGVVPTVPDLTVTKSSLPETFVQGQAGVIYEIRLNNVGNAASSGTMTVTDTLDSNLTFVSASGTGWVCSPAGQVITCTSSAAISPAGFSVINVTANVKTNGQTSVTNNVSVTGGGESNTANNSFQLITAVTAPDLTVTKSSSPQTFVQGQAGVTYEIRVNNVGNAASSGTVTVTDTLDSNLTYVSASGTGWVCSPAGQVITCTSSAAISPASFSAINVTANVKSNGQTSVTNNVSVTGGGESNTANNSFQLITTVTAATAPDLTVTKSSSPQTFVQGQAGVTYEIRVNNVGNAASSGTMTVTDTLDSNLTYVSASGTGWVCSPAGQVITCTSSAAISPASFSAINVTANVQSNGQTSVTNNVSVTGGGESNTANNSFQLITTVTAPTGPDLTVTKSSSPQTFVQGQAGVTYEIRVNNVGNAASSGTMTVTDTLDSNLTYVSASGTGWVCSPAGQVITCTSSAAISPAAFSAINVTANVKSNGQTSVTNNVSVTGGGESNTANNSFQLITTVTAATAPDLTVTKSSSPQTFFQGQAGVTYQIRVNNIGSAASSGTVTVTDTLDSNLTFVSASGTGWVCSPAGQVITCTSSAAISPASFSAINITSNVKSNGQTSVANNVSVTGGGESNTANNSFQLITTVFTDAAAIPTLSASGLVALAMLLAIMSALLLKQNYGRSA